MSKNIQDIYSRDAAFQKFQVLKTNRNKRHRYGEFFVSTMAVSSYRSTDWPWNIISVGWNIPLV